MIKENLMIKNKYEKSLSVIVEIPKKDLKEFIIISHCFTCSKIYKLYNNISKILVDKNYAVVRYDVMGLGDSEGDFSDTSFTSNVEDLISVYDFISDRYKAPKYLFGHSLGSLVSIKAANTLDSIAGLSTIGSPLDFNNLIRLFSKYEDDFDQSGKIRVNLSGRNIELGRDFLEDLKNTDSKEIIQKLEKPILIFHSNSDRVVPYSDGLHLFDLIASDKSFITLNNTDHLASKVNDSYYIGQILSTWLDSFYLD